ncbi:MAG TPA: SDR family oxidoreductase [Anaerolineaceae bacterium]|nr:SDR family oxidoreductase [Anaerolineaceae bacterium]
MKILITGAAGFIGSHLCDRLIQEGHEIIGMDNFITGSPDNLTHLTGSPKFSFILHDVANYIIVPDKVDAVLHFASPASPNPESPYGFPNLPIQTMKAGALGTLNTLGVARANNARYILASTSEIYGDPVEHPQKETYWGNVDPIGERSVYDEAKRFAEALTMAYHRFHKINTGIARIFNTYGPRMRLDDGRAVPNFLMQALKKEPLTIYGDGEQTRSFCYVDDLVDGIVKLLYSQEHEPINIGNPEEISIKDLATTINGLFNNPSGAVLVQNKAVGKDPDRRQPDITRAKNLLGWSPTIDLISGLKKTIPYFQQRL